MKSFTTPYSHARSNADCALQLEKREYLNFLEPSCLVYDEFNGSQVVRNRSDLDSDEIYLEAHRQGFEFTHHDVIGNLSHRSSYERKVDRLKKFKGKRDFVFFYHYRVSPNQAIDTLAVKLAEFCKAYAINGRSCKIIVFTQELVPTVNQRGLQHLDAPSNVCLFVVKSLRQWAGDDDDLLAEMIRLGLRS